MQHVDITEIVRAVSTLLGKFASKGHQLDENEDGVRIYQKQQGVSHDVQFAFVTIDLIEVRVTLDMREVHKKGRDYLEAMVWDVMQGIETRQAERIKNREIILPTRSEISQIVGGVSLH